MHQFIRARSATIILLISPLAAAEETVCWALKDPAVDGVEGTRTERAYADAELHLRAPKEPIVVAVIDTGVDIHHPDLEPVIWTNPREAAGTPGADDDHNGYVDDLHGWNFIGSSDGKRQLVAGRMEVTREVQRLERLAKDGKLPATEAARLERIRGQLERMRQEFAAQLSQAVMRESLVEQLAAKLTAQGLTDPTFAGIKAYAPKSPSGQLFKQLFLQIDPERLSPAQMHERLAANLNSFDAHFGEDFDESELIGDHPDQLDERVYGNARVDDTNLHGTHVAGIIGAVRGNGIGVAGQCAWVRIMPVRAVPDGDERDKDVANAVRYAVDNGARIINMSFGKGISPHKAEVDAAFRYAAEKGVLLVHACGNDGQDNDQQQNFPNRHPLPGADGAKQPEIGAWIEVGASTQKKGDHLAAPFSNYGQTAVDLFAPGVEVISTVPGGGTEPEDGTSMAGPEVSGVAALVWSQHPELSASALKQALLDHARRFPGLRVIKPGTTSQRVPFASLSVSGGIVDAYATLVALDPDRKTGTAGKPESDAPPKGKPDDGADPPSGKPKTDDGKTGTDTPP